MIVHTKKNPNGVAVCRRNILKVDIPQSCSEILQQFNSYTV